MKTPKDFRNLSVKTYVNAVLERKPGEKKGEKKKKKDWAPSNKQSDEILCNSRARDEAFVSGAFVGKGTDHFPRQTFQLVPGTGFKSSADENNRHRYGKSAPIVDVEKLEEDE